MEKNKKDKKNKNKAQKKQKKNKGEHLEKHELLSYVAGVPGTDLSWFFKKLSESVLQTPPTDLDYTTIRFIEYSASQRSYYNLTPNRSTVTNNNDGVDISRALPLEVLYMIASQLQPRDCLNLIRVNKKLNQVFNDVSIWRNFCLNNGLEKSASDALTTVADYKKLIFTEKWTFYHERTYRIDEKRFGSEVWKLVAINIDHLRANFQYDCDPVSFLVVNMAEFDSELIEPDGTKITYLDMCKSFVRDVSTRPHGPITKKQFKRATARKSGLGKLGDFHQPSYHPALGVFFIGEAKLKERIANENLDIPANNYIQYFTRQLTDTIIGHCLTLYPYSEDSIVFQAVYDCWKNVVLANALMDTGFS